MLATAAQHEDPGNSAFSTSPVPPPKFDPRSSITSLPVQSESLEGARQEHHEWASRIWSRMDRDDNGRITRKELDCEEFRSVLRRVLAPSSAHPCGGGATYARAQTNQEQALHFCLRKADINNDGWLSFVEFRAMMWVLRNEGPVEDTTRLVFALFDLDTDNYISENEFREVYRFYLGHDPTSEEFWQEWHKLAPQGQSCVSRQQYTTWLQTGASPIFRQHAPPPVVDTPVELTVAGSRGAQGSSDPTASPMSRSMLSFTELSQRARRFPKDNRGWPLVGKLDINARSKWNAKFNSKINPNDILPMGERNYFMKTHSLPQLSRFYSTHNGFETQFERLNTPAPPKEKWVLSTDTQPVFNKERHQPGGAMREHLHGAPCGDVGLWEDNWQTPLRYRSRFKVSDRPVPAGSFFDSSYEHMGPMAHMLNKKYG